MPSVASARLPVSFREFPPILFLTDTAGKPRFGKGITMKAILTVLAAVLTATITADRATAQAPASPQPVPSYVVPPEAPSGIDKQYGLHPGLKRLIPTTKGCDNCGGGLFGRQSGPFHKLWAKLTAETPPPPPVNNGTLAFPNHTFVRSPRDFFMMDQ
jgi:hypothetical protein